MRTAKTLIRLGGCPGWSESLLGAHSFCWFCHVAAYASDSISSLRAWILLVKVQLSQAETKADKMSVRISLTLEASEMFLSLHMIFSLERAAVVWAILERISVLDSSLEITDPMYLKFSTASIYLGLSFESIWVVCHHFCLIKTNLYFATLCLLYRDDLPGRQLLLPLLHLQQWHRQSGSW